ncbi:MAG: HAMP domain-containing histidine kinase [Clostridiales bacterium]|nr:HAMP domain-containing histidine kinase [Clostridiales bacterium]
MTGRAMERQIRSQRPLRHSLRRRIMAIFIGLMAVMMFAIWAINNFWLEYYYMNQKLQMMEEAYEELDRVVMAKVNAGEDIGDVITAEMEQEWALWKLPPKGAEREKEETMPDPRTVTEEEESGTEDGEEDSLITVLRSYGEKNNITTVLIDSDTGKALLSSGREGDFLAQRVQQYVLGMGKMESNVLAEHDNYLIETNYDSRSHSSNMESWGFFSDNRTLFIMSMPLASIHDSVQLTNRFTTFVGIAVLIAGCIIMYFATDRVTKPILQLAALSERMSNLDFDVSYQGHADDEIGIPGESMNTLSGRLKEAIGALQEANRQLQHDIEEKIQIDEMRKEFIANVSHELKTPIALIQGYAEGLTEGMCEDEESRNYYCEVIMDEASKMNKMVKQLLTLTALEFGNDTPLITTFDLCELIQDLVNSSSILLQQNEATISYEKSEPIYVSADEFKLEEVITNYLTNAIHHVDGERIIRITTKRQEDTVKVIVYNTGNHIPEEDLPNLWTKFYKVDKARTRSYGGSGIGLSIVKAIMDAHHQQCGVENVPGGVEFWFTVKVQEADK